jgi:hypothetical protein
MTYPIEDMAALIGVRGGPSYVPNDEVEVVPP